MDTDQHRWNCNGSGNYREPQMTQMTQMELQPQLRSLAKAQRPQRTAKNCNGKKRGTATATA
jgi:hypothetical protein